MIDLINIPI